MLEMHHNIAGMQEIYNGGRKQWHSAKRQIQRGKDGIDMSKPGTTKYKTGRISFYPFSLNAPTQCRPQGELIAELLGQALYVVMSVCAFESLSVCVWIEKRHENRTGERTVK